jgi:hypothetical protein
MLVPASQGRPNQALHLTRPATAVLGVRSSPTRAGQVSCVVRYVVGDAGRRVHLRCACSGGTTIQRPPIFIKAAARVFVRAVSATGGVRRCELGRALGTPVSEPFPEGGGEPGARALRLRRRRGTPFGKLRAGSSPARPT